MTASDIPHHQRAALTEHLAGQLTAARWLRYREVVARRTRHICVVLEDLYQGHNASAVLRTCEALGFQDVHAIEARNVFKAHDEIALGAAQWLTVRRWSTPADAVAALRSNGYRIVATSLDANSLPLDQLPVDAPTALCFGTELTGLTPALLAAADATVHIPMLGFTQSFNVSVSAALCLHHLGTRLRASTIDWALPADTQDSLLLDWLLATRPSMPDLAARFLAS